MTCQIENPGRDQAEAEQQNQEKGEGAVGDVGCDEEDFSLSQTEEQQWHKYVPELDPAHHPFLKKQGKQSAQDNCDTDAKRIHDGVPAAEFGDNLSQD